MKTIKLLLITMGLAAFAAAQSAPSFSITQGTGSVSTLPCSGPQNVGSIYTQIVNGGPTSICQQTGLSSLGAGAFSWQPVQTTTTGGGGSLVVASGKTATISNTLTFAGTDGTTATFPSVSIAVPGTVVNNCGTANACSATNVSATAKVVVGVTAALNGASPAVATVTAMPAFTSSSSYVCTANVNSAAASTHVLAVNYVSATSVTFTGANGATDTVSYICMGN